MNTKTKCLSRVIIVSGSILVSVILVSAGIAARSRARSQPPLFYITALPSEPSEYPFNTIAVLDPTKQTCAPPVYLDPTLGHVDRIRLSPRRDQIVYTTYSLADESTSLWVMKADGSERQPILLHAPWPLSQENVSADGHYVAFIKPIERREAETWETWVWDRQDRSTRQVMTATWQMAWSPRREVMAIYRWTDGRLYLVQPDGTVVNAFDPAIDLEPGLVWSPDGRRIGFASSGWTVDAPSPFRWVDEVYALDVENGRVERLTHSGEQYSERGIYGLSWSPDGKRMAFGAFTDGPAAGRRSGLLFVLNLQSGREVEVAEEMTSAPVWSPDSKQLAYVAVKGNPKDLRNHAQIYVRNIETGRTTQLTCDEEIKEELAW